MTLVLNRSLNNQVVLMSKASLCQGLLSLCRGLLCSPSNLMLRSLLQRQTTLTASSELAAASWMQMVAESTSSCSKPHAGSIRKRVSAEVRRFWRSSGLSLPASGALRIFSKLRKVLMPTSSTVAVQLRRPYKKACLALIAAERSVELELRSKTAP